MKWFIFVSVLLKMESHKVDAIMSNYNFWHQKHTVGFGLLNKKVTQWLKLCIHSLGIILKVNL
jgi:hypothetical protein